MRPTKEEVQKLKSRVLETLDTFDFKKDPVAALGRAGLNKDKVKVHGEVDVGFSLGKYNANTDQVSYSESRESTILHELRHRAIEKSKEFFKDGDDLRSKMRKSNIVSPKHDINLSEELTVRMFDALVHGDNEESLNYAGSIADKFAKALKPTERNEYLGGVLVSQEDTNINGILLMQAIADVINVKSGRERSYNNYPAYILKATKEVTGYTLKNNGE